MTGAGGGGGGESRRLDWPAAHARLERFRRGIEGSEGLAPETAGRILQDRAARLARRADPDVTRPGTVDLLVFPLAGERYGLEVRHVLEVMPLRDLVPLPGAPAVVAGLGQHRGQVLPILDLRALMGVRGGETVEATRVIVVHGGDATVGLLAGGSPVLLRAPVDGLPPDPPAGDRSLVRGVTEEMVTILDVQALVRDPRVVVDDGVTS